MGWWPSAELKPLRPRWARAGLDLLWWLLFALALVAVVGGIWRGYAEFRATTAFAQLGLQAQPDPDANCAVVVVPVTKTARAAWPRGISARKGGCLIPVGHDEVDSSYRLPDVAALLQGPDNSKAAQVFLQKPGEDLKFAAEFLRSAANVSQARPPIWDWLDGLLIAATATVGLLYAGVALVLRRRRPDDPVSNLISFAFVLMAHIGTEAFWFSAGMIGYDVIFGILAGQSLLLIAAPAFPNGTYVPSWARWLKWVVPLLLVVAIRYSESDTVIVLSGGVLILGLPALCVALLFLRYFRMSDGLEKQQVKWAVFGLSVGLLLVLVSYVVPTPSLGLARTSPLQFAWLSVLSDLLRVVGYGLIPAGVAVSLLEYRLNDADLVVGKSLGYAIVTAIVLVTWAAGQALLSDAAKRWFGTTTVASAVTALIPVLLFAPTRAWVLSWTEARFQPALVKLRKLPDKLARWEAYRTPDEVADAALADIVNGVGASYAAMLGDDGSEWRVLAARGIESDKAMAQLESGPPAAGGPDPFPIRKELDDQIDRPDLLAIGPRSDGASFTKDERAAIATILEPLSNALQASALRQRHTLRVESALTGIDHRLARLERELAPPRKRRR